ncbi:MAG: diguanylate cyclase [Coriobacteriia bacterium]
MMSETHNRSLSQRGNRLRKRIARSVTVSWRDQPTRQEIEALRANIQRVGLVIRIRWALVAVLVIYSLFGGVAYYSRVGAAELVSRMIVPALALCLVVLYNAFYQTTYRRLGNISVLNTLQLTFDAFVITVLVHYSGGVDSWFWPMYALLVLEAAFILPRPRSAWRLTLLCAILLGGLLTLEALGVIGHVMMPFMDSTLHQDVSYIAVRFGWQLAVLAGTASVASLLVAEQRSEKVSSRVEAIVDEASGLYTRSYFMRALGAEVRRARNEERSLHVILIDIDNFGEFNRRFGIDRGDALLLRIAEQVEHCTHEAGADMMTVNLAARFGGEEFGVLLVEQSGQGAPTPGDAVQLAECIRFTIAATLLGDVGVTASLGVASLPEDGIVAEELLDAADAALAAAFHAGGDCVVSAASFSAELDAVAEE